MAIELIKTIPKKLLAVILPPICHICKDALTMVDNNNICPPCLIEIDYMTQPLCQICGRTFHGINGHLCGMCTLAPPPFERALSALAYTGAIRKAIHRFKYNGETRLSKLFGAFMHDQLNTLNTNKIDIIMPIPLHKKRLCERGFNQSLLLAKVVAKEANAIVDHKSLKRVRHTTPQVELKGKERAMNVKGAFELTGNPALNGKTVLLVDDVYTTGSTISECAKILKKEGSRVIALTLARAL